MLRPGIAPLYHSPGCCRPVCLLHVSAVRRRIGLPQRAGIQHRASPQWLVVNRLDVGEKENPIATDNPRIRSLFTADVLKALKEKARASGVELFLNLETSDETFIESINVQTARGSIAAEESDVGHACAETEKRLTALYGNPVKISACKALKIRRMPALYMEYQVEKPAMAHIQYLVQLKPDRYTVMTLTCRPANLSKLRPEFDAIIASFRPT